MRNILLALVALLLLGFQNVAGPVAVFLERDVRTDGTDRLQFVDVLTGETTSVEVQGDRYTPFGRAIMFLDTQTQRVRLATADGRVRNHPFIQLTDGARRVDWLVNKNQVVWTLTQPLADGQLQTITTLANLDGSSPREVLTDGPRPGIRAQPVAFAADSRAIYFDYQPDGIADFTPFPQFAGLFAVDLATGENAMLPGEPGCFCGAGLGSDTLVRLDLTRDLQGFDVVVTNLGSATTERIDALRLTNYTQAGQVLLTPDGTRAVYALAQVRDFGGPNQAVRTVFVLVDLVSGTQSTLTNPITTFVEPLAWTEDNTAIIFASADPNLDGTWKITLDDGRLLKVADATYLGEF
jgi:hypothetical protein